MDNRLQSYIISGGSAADRDRLAYDIALKALGGRNYGEDADHPAHPDLHEIVPIPPETSKTSTNLEIRVSQSREVRETAQVKPIEADAHVFVFHDCDKMNNNAQNALLATIEEPPTPCIFLFLCANPRVLLPTVRSRCALLRTDGSTAADAAAADPKEAAQLAQALMLSLSAADASEAVMPLSKLSNDDAAALLDAARSACMRAASRAAAGSDQCTRALDGAELGAKCLDLLAANVKAVQVAGYIVSFA